MPATATYRFIARGKPALLLIDGRPAAGGDSPFGGPPLRLNRGLHPIQIDFAYAHGPHDFRIAWAMDSEPFVPLDRMLLSAEIVPGDPMPASLESLRELAPDYIVLSAGFALREREGSIGAEFYRALREGPRATR